jgi:hypothetical protein
MKTNIGDRRFKPKGRREERSLKVLQDHHQEALRLLSTGMKPDTISKLLGVHIETVRNTKYSKLGKAFLRMLHSERNITVSKSAERIEALSPLAVEKFEEILLDDMMDPSLQYRVARDTLKSAGIMVDRKQVEHAYLNADQIDDLKTKFKKDFKQSMDEAIFTVVDDVDTGDYNNGDKNNGKE